MLKFSKENNARSVIPKFDELREASKSQFKTVLLITHLDSLKDIVDTTIEIDKVDGYAHVNL